MCRERKKKVMPCAPGDFSFRRSAFIRFQGNMKKGGMTTPEALILPTRVAGFRLQDVTDRGQYEESPTI